MDVQIISLLDLGGELEVRRNPLHWQRQDLIPGMSHNLNDNDVKCSSTKYKRNNNYYLFTAVALQQAITR